MKAEFAHSRHSAEVVLLAVVLSLSIGWLDLHTTEVVVTIVPLLLAGFVLGMVQPAAAWRWALLLAAGLPAVALVARVLAVSTAEPSRLDPRIAVAAFVFALVGCYVAVAIRSLRSS